MRGIKFTSVVFPDPVGPTIARLLPAGMRQIHVPENGHAVIGEIQMPEFNLASQFPVGCLYLNLRPILNLGFSTRISSMRPMEAVPRWKMLITHPSAMIGHVSMTM